MIAALWSIVMVVWIFTRRGRKRPQWFIWAWVLLAVGILAWSVLAYFQDFQKAAVSQTTYGIIGWAKTMVSGFVAGIFVTLLMSGELFTARVASANTKAPVHEGRRAEGGFAPSYYER